MAANDDAAMLGAVPLFSSLSKRECQMIAKSATVVEVEAGAELFREGDTGRDFYLVLAGTVAVRRGRRKVAALGPGDYFGELAVLDDAPRSATVTAETPARLLVIGRRELAALLEEVPVMGRKLLVAMAARLRQADERAVAH